MGPWMRSSPSFVEYYRARYYQPGIGRFGSEDPIGLRGGPSLFAYARGGPVGGRDPLGLELWVCVREANLGVGNHAYFWDDSGKHRPCGMNWKRGNPEENQGNGPADSTCRIIPDGGKKAGAVFDCCKKHANDGFYFPFWNDCHTAAGGCLRANGLEMPPDYPDRFGGCHGCWLPQDRFNRQNFTVTPPPGPPSPKCCPSGGGGGW